MIKGDPVHASKIWIEPARPPSGFLNELGDLSPLERQLLYNRGLGSAEAVERFLTGDKTLEDPFLLLDLPKAVDRVLLAVEEGEQITIYGDYDADGVCGTLLLEQVLQRAGAKVSHYLPDRISEGYGLNPDAVRRLRSGGTDLLVCVDCGVRSVDEVELANEEGLEVIITDHHEPGTELPPAFALINPKQEGETYPYTQFSGVGLAYKLACALRMRLGMPEPTKQLDLAAIGTVADLAPLVGENRSLVREGLRVLNTTSRPGLRALVRKAGFREGGLDSRTIAFGLAPRLNAAGRLDSAELAYRLLETDDANEAEHLAGELDSLNRQRQKMTEEVVDRARQMVVVSDEVPALLFAFDPDFHEGLLGLVASRLVEEFYRPVVVGRTEGGFAKASARSIPGFHITHALERCSDLLVRYGGHSRAAGFTTRLEDLERLMLKLQESAADAFADSRPQPTLTIDAYVRFEDLDSGFLEFIESMEPFGLGNPAPVLAAREVGVLEKRLVGSDKKHLKLTLKREGRVFDAIAFKQGYREGTLGRNADFAFHLERNEYLGVESLQLNVLDVRTD